MIDNTILNSWTIKLEKRKKRITIDIERTGLQFAVDRPTGTELCFQPPQETVGETRGSLSTEPIIVRRLSRHQSPEWQPFPSSTQRPAYLVHHPVTNSYHLLLSLFLALVTLKITVCLFVIMLGFHLFGITCLSLTWSIANKINWLKII